MSKPLATRPRPFSLRLTVSERAALERLADGQPLGGYIKGRLFGGQTSPTKAGGSSDRVLLAQVLGQLGTSTLTPSLKALAEAAASGSLHIDDLTVSRLHDACDDLRGMHLLLMEALGKRVPVQARRPVRLSTQFLRAAMNVGDPR